MMYSTRSCTADDSTLRFNTADDARKNFHHLKKTSHSSHLTFFLKCESISFGLHIFLYLFQVLRDQVYWVRHVQVLQRQVLQLL